MTGGDRLVNEGPDALLALYDRSLPEVYGYLVRRCGSASLAEDLTGETFLAAVDAVRAGRSDRLSAAWLVTVARNKLVDHWRRTEREDRRRHLMVAPEPPPDVDEWVEELDLARAVSMLDRLGADHRAALTLRYLDGLSVPQVADQLDRTVHAAEALLMRAKAAFRRVYAEEHDDDG